MALNAQATAVLNGYQATEAALRRRVLEFVQGQWTRLGSWDRVDVDRFVAAILPTIQGGMAQTAALTDAYLANIEAVTFGRHVRPIGVRAADMTTEAIRGVSATEVYSRAGSSVYAALSDGKTFGDAVKGGMLRALSMASTDLQLAKTHTVRRVAQARDTIVGTRRVIRGAKSCGLCIVAATQRYTRSDLMPIHPACDCGCVPIWAEEDPGQVIDPDQLANVHARIAERFGAYSSGARKIPGVKDPATAGPLEYRNVLVSHRHGEIGPVLGVRGQDFTTPGDL
jgi:hypothetical protein